MCCVWPHKQTNRLQIGRYASPANPCAAKAYTFSVCRKSNGSKSLAQLHSHDVNTEPTHNHTLMHMTHGSRHTATSSRTPRKHPNFPCIRELFTFFVIRIRFIYFIGIAFVLRFIHNECCGVPALVTVWVDVLRVNVRCIACIVLSHQSLNTVNNVSIWSVYIAHTAIPCNVHTRVPSNTHFCLLRRSFNTARPCSSHTHRARVHSLSTIHIPHAL